MAETTSATRDGVNEKESQAGSKILSITKSFVGTACFWAIVYSIGYYKFSVAWIVVPLSVNLLFKIATRSSEAEEEEELEHKPINSVADLPRWVYFPDSDRAEWLNKLIGQLWPALQDHVNVRYAGMRDQRTRDNMTWFNMHQKKGALKQKLKR